MKGPNGIADFRPAPADEDEQPSPTAPPRRNAQQGADDQSAIAEPAEVEAEHTGELHVAETHARPGR